MTLTFGCIFSFIGLHKPDLKLGVCLACDSAVCLTDVSLDPLCVCVCFCGLSLQRCNSPTWKITIDQRHKMSKTLLSLQAHLGVAEECFRHHRVGLVQAGVAFQSVSYS